MCEDLTVSNVYVKNPWYAQNGDGIDIESCKNVLLENSTFDVGDDGICIKSGRDAEGRKRAMPTENVIVRNCTVYHAHGGFVIGSEMSGGARNIYVERLYFYRHRYRASFQDNPWPRWRGRKDIHQQYQHERYCCGSDIVRYVLYGQGPVSLAG